MLGFFRVIPALLAWLGVLILAIKYYKQNKKWWVLIFALISIGYTLANLKYIAIRVVDTVQGCRTYTLFDGPVNSSLKRACGAPPTEWGYYGSNYIEY